MLASPNIVSRDTSCSVSQSPYPVARIIVSRSTSRWLDIMERMDRPPRLPPASRSAVNLRSPPTSPACLCAMLPSLSPPRSHCTPEARYVVDLKGTQRSVDPPSPRPHRAWVKVRSRFPQISTDFHSLLSCPYH